MSPLRKKSGASSGAARKKKSQDGAHAHESRLARGRGDKGAKARRSAQAGSGRPSAPELREDGKIRLN